MPTTLDQFWNLLAESGLLKPAELQKLSDTVAMADGNLAPEKITKYLITKQKLSTYQAKILLGGRSGPFFYGDYQIYDRIESGRLAGIFRAIHTPTRHPVCLFFLSGAAMQDEQVLADLAYQAAIANRASVGHPHLFRCYHLADEGSFKFIVVEDLKGKRVERLLATTGALSAGEACRIARQAALGLARLHAMGHVHGEMRPANIWLDGDNHAKLLLFPLYRDPMSPPRAWLTKARSGTGETAGKVPSEANYIAPELIAGDREPDARSDIYSLGCTLYHMLANEPPCNGGSTKQKLRQHLKETPRPLNEVNPQIPAGLAKLVAYMMAKDPDMRYQKAESVVEALLPHIPPELAQTQPKPPSRASRAYEAWLVENVSAVPAPPAAPASATPAHAVEDVAEQALAEQAPMVAAPVVAAPVAATPIAGVPIASAPMVAVPIAAPAGVPIAGAAVAAPVMAAVPVGAPVAVATAVPVGAVAMAAPVFGGVAEQQFAAPAFGEVGAGAGVSTSAMSYAERKRQERRRKRIIMGIVAAIVLLAAGTLAGLHFGGVVNFEEQINALLATPEPTTEPAAEETARAAAVAKAKQIADEQAAAEAQVEPVAGLDDGIWASPTRGKPLDLKYLALGMQGVAALRPADILKHPEGKRLLAPEKSPAIEQLVGQHPLGTVGHWVQHTLPGLCGAPLEKIEQVIIAWPESGGESGTIAVVARLAEPADEAALLQAWGNPEPVEGGKEKYFKRDTTAYYLPQAEQGRVVVVAPVEEVKEAIEGSMVLWATPEPEKLLQSSDADRQFTMVMPTRFFETAGKAAFDGRGARLHPAVNWLLTGGPDAAGNTPEPPKALLLSAHFAPEAFFAEARVFNNEASLENTSLAEPVRDRFAQIPKAVKLFRADLILTPFSKSVLVDLDDKVKAWDRDTRFGTADKQIVVRSYLPPPAALHLALGAHLCLIENLNTSGAFVQAAPGGAPAAAAGANQPQTAADKLKKVTSLSFPRNTLEVSMQLLADDLGVPVVILGTDLQLEGITKNQSFGLEEKDKPAVEIFKTIFAKANPDGKLVYVIKPDDAGTETIYVTTRAAVTKRGDKLPPEFAK
ncbi:MAG TPA: serine/threonine-protein kinase [Pirellulales bacterium]|jgi:serine/threonine-protein kinase|nr:serine/threonine-protein kinase [Pirellulales bacterium]